MDEKSIELARQGLDVAYQELRPGYRQIGELLSRELAINERNDTESIEAKNNAKLLLDFVQQLPEADSVTKHGVRSSFTVSSPEVARAIQSSVIWVRTWSEAFDWSGAGYFGMGYPTIDFAVRPYWVLGGSYRTRKDKQFVLAPASRPIHRGDVDRGNYVDLDSWSPVHGNLNRTESGLLIFSPKRSEQDRISTLSSKYFDVPLQEDERYPAAIDHRSLGADTISMYARVANQRIQKIDGITDHQLAANSVFDKLYRLATLFDKKDKLDSLLKNYPKTIESGE
jgi:hypothetical protein